MRIFQVDTFTATRFAGNPATVVLDADGQADNSLQAIAREFPHAEVAFVMAANGADHDLRVRFFNARKEAPFVGHATLAAHAVLLALGRRSLGSLKQMSGTGVINVAASMQKLGGIELPLIEFRQETPELEPPLQFKTTLRVAEALRLPATKLHEVMPARIARRGSTRLLVPVSDRQVLDELLPNMETLVDMGKEIGVDGYFIFAASKDAEEMSTEARMFCPALGIPEDPVSGNAHAMLAAYLWDLGFFGKKQASFIGRQGRSVNRPGEVRVRLELQNGSLVAAHIGGSAVIMTEGTLAI